MKKIFLILTIILGVNSAFAQNGLKFAIVDSDKVLDSLPTRMQADAEITRFVEDAQQTIEELSTILQREYNAYIDGQDTLSEFQKERIEKELTEQQEIIQLKQQTFEKDLETYNKRFYEPIQENFNKAVENVSVRLKLNYVLDKKTLLYTNGGIDITKEVAAELLRLENERMATN